MASKRECVYQFHLNIIYCTCACTYKIDNVRMKKESLFVINLYGISQGLLKPRRALASLCATTLNITNEKKIICNKSFGFEIYLVSMWSKEKKIEHFIEIYCLCKWVSVLDRKGICFSFSKNFERFA